jgi:hypothetical protein
LPHAAFRIDYLPLEAEKIYCHFYNGFRCLLGSPGKGDSCSRLMKLLIDELIGEKNLSIG